MIARYPYCPAALFMRKSCLLFTPQAFSDGLLRLECAFQAVCLVRFRRQAV